MTRTHYFDPQPPGPSRPSTVPLVLPDVTLTLRTDRGVFSAGGVVRGTKLLLLEAPPPPTSGEVVDLGCGYGAVAVTLARQSPGATIWAVDVNQRALELTAANARDAGVHNVHPTTPESLPPDLRPDAIYSNPPVRIGKEALHALLHTYLTRLAVGGHAYLVVNKNLGADSLARWLEESGWHASRRCSRMGYRVLDVIAAPAT